MSKKEDNEIYKKTGCEIEARIRNIPEGLSEEGDEQLAQKGLDFMRAEKAKSRRRKNWLIPSVCAAASILVIIVGVVIWQTQPIEPRELYYEEDLIYLEEGVSISDYNQNNQTAFLNCDNVTGTEITQCTYYRFGEDDSLAYIVESFSYEDGDLYEEIALYVKYTKQDLTFFSYYNSCNAFIRISGIEISYSEITGEDGVFEYICTFEYEEVGYYMSVVTTSENSMEGLVERLLSSVT